MAIKIITENDIGEGLVIAYGKLISEVKQVVVVQEAGDSEDKVISQNAITGWLFGNTVRLGENAKTLDAGAVALGLRAEAGAESSTALGGRAGASGSFSTAVGLSAKATGTSSVALGMQTEASKASTTALGSGSKATGPSSTALGGGAVASDINSTAIGTRAEASKTNSAAIGKSAEASGTASTALGADAVASSANRMQLGSSTTNVYTQNEINIVSDRRDKADIENSALGLEFISKLRPVSYKLDPRSAYREAARKAAEEDESVMIPEFNEIVPDGTHKGVRPHYGLIAQEVKEVMDELGVDFAGYTDQSVKGSTDELALRYGEFIAPLIKAVQEQQEQINYLTMRVEALEKE